MDTGARWSTHVEAVSVVYVRRVRAWRRRSAWPQLCIFSRLVLLLHNYDCEVSGQSEVVHVQVETPREVHRSAAAPCTTDTTRVGVGVGELAATNTTSPRFASLLFISERVNAPQRVSLGKLLIARTVFSVRVGHDGDELVNENEVDVPVEVGTVPHCPIILRIATCCYAPGANFDNKL